MRSFWFTVGEKDMKNRFASVVLLLVLSTTMNHLVAQNSATFEVWSEANGLNKLSDHATDSVTFTVSGSVATLTIELREEYRGSPTRRLQMTIPGFSGVGQYKPTEGQTSAWQNFSSSGRCDCFAHLVNDIVITHYDSSRGEAKGTFQWKCRSFATSGTELIYRIRNGTFEVGQQGKITLTVTPGDTIRIPDLAEDTTIILTVEAKRGNDLVDSARIFVNDPTSTQTEFFADTGITNSNGRQAVPITFRKSTPSGDYTLKFYAEKNGLRRSDTIPVVLRYGDRYWHYTCAGARILTFDAGEGNRWKPIAEGSPIVSASGRLEIGGVIRVDGKLRINTTAGQQRVFLDSGRVYIPDVQFTSSDRGDLDLNNIVTGGDFQLPNCDGIVEMLTESALTKKLPGGVELQLNSFSFINRADAHGLALKGTISMSNTRTGCESTIDTSGGFDLTDPGRQKLSIGVSITREHGFENLSVNAANVAVTSALCLEEFSASADFEREIYSLAGKAKFPVKGTELSLGGSVLFKNHPATPSNTLALDSLSVSLELGNCRPIPNTVFCFRGLGLSTSGLANPTAIGNAYRATITVESAEQAIIDRASWIPEIFGQPKIAQFEGTLEYRHPLIFTGALTTRLIRLEAISSSKPWQAEGTVTASWDLNNRLSLNGDMKIGHLGADDYVLNVNGGMQLYWHPVVGISGSVNGLARIPNPGEQLLERRFVGTALRFMQLSGSMPQTLGQSTASVAMNENDGFDIRASVDVSQNPIDYIRSFGRMGFSFQYKDGVPTFKTFHDTLQGPTIIRTKGVDEVQATTADTVVVTDDIERLFIVVSDDGPAPTTRLRSPDGVVHEDASQDGKILRFATPNGEIVQWTLVDPQRGAWIVETDDATASTTVEITANRTPVTFTFSASNQEPNVIVADWVPVSTTATGDVRFYLDDDALGFDGVLVGIGRDVDGTLSIQLPEGLTGCSYRIHGRRELPGRLPSQSYADLAISGPGSSVPAPVEVRATANVQGRTTISWRMNQGTSPHGFSVVIRDADGRDSVIATTFGDVRSIVVTISDHESKFVRVVAFDSQGTTSCPTEGVNIVTSVHQDRILQPTSMIGLSLAPNPAESLTSVRFVTRNEAELTVTDVTGRIVLRQHLPSSDGDWQSIDVEASQFPTGTYLVTIRTSAESASQILSVMR